MLDLPAIYAEYGASWLPQMLWACLGTLRLSAVSFLVAVVLGLVGALGRTSPLPLLRGLAIGYIEICRGLPALVILYIVYYVPPHLLQPAATVGRGRPVRRRPRP